MTVYAINHMSHKYSGNVCVGVYDIVYGIIV